MTEYGDTGGKYAGLTVSFSMRGLVQYKVGEWL